MLKRLLNEWIGLNSCWEDIRSPKTDIEYNSAMRFILVWAHKGRYGLFVNRDNDIVWIAFKRNLNRMKKIKNVIIVERPSVTNSSRACIFIMCSAIRMIKWVKSFILIRYWSSLSSRDWRVVMISYWKKTIFLIMNQVNIILYVHERIIMNSSIISIVLHHPIYFSLKTVDNRSNNSFINILIGMITLRKDWFWRGEVMFLSGL